MRGKVRFGLVFLALLGITPACAGKRINESNFTEFVEDHPRVCGEKYFVRDCRQIKPGSPPRVRGKAVADIDSHMVGGITPACAGKSLLSARRKPRPRDHPRVCGEKLYFAPEVLGTLGSPPRVRGKVPITVSKVPPDGITPACAGKRPGSCPTAWPGRDHPRVCGEKFFAAVNFSENQGSPPRVRGKAGKARMGRDRKGITPACAGKSICDAKSK